MNDQNKLADRQDIDDMYKWKLEDIYPNDDMWEEDFKKVKTKAEGISEFKGILAESADNIRQCLLLSDSIGQLMSKLFVYSHMRKDQDQSNTKYQQMKDRAVSLSSNISARMSFIVPELLTMDQKVLKRYIKNTKELKIYQHQIDDMLRQKEHVLSDNEEKLLAMSKEMASTADNVFSVFNTADLSFPNIKDEEGNEVELTHGRYTKFIESEKRNVRKDAFKAMYNTYSKYRNSIGAMLSGSIKTEIFYAVTRKYNSCIEAALDNDNIPVSVYEKLIETVHNGLPLLHKYMDIKKRVLNLDEIHMFDIYTPLVQPAEKHIEYKDALKKVKEGLKPLGEDYESLIDTASSDGWIDVYENRGKTTGAYSWGAYPVHPFVLLNYQNTINDVFTIAHELGHAMHSYYTNNKQPYIYADYSIFVAEVASTVNEALLVNYMLDNSKDKNEKTYIIGHFLEKFRATLYRQVMFAEFEKIAHESFENGKPLSQEGFCNIYYELNKKYFGQEVNVDKDIEMEWARIPHFYNGFYVYKYATGFSAAIAIAKSILNGDKGAVSNYKKFLSSGSSDYPLELLKIANVDLSTSKPVEDALSFFEKLLDEFDLLLQENNNY